MNATLAESIRRFRKNKGFSQVEFSELIGASQASISLWEKGNVTPEHHHVKALIALGLPTDGFTDTERRKYGMSTEQKETAEQLIAVCTLIATKDKNILPSEARMKALKTAIADYEASLAKPVSTAEKGVQA